MPVLVPACQTTGPRLGRMCAGRGLLQAALYGKRERPPPPRRPLKFGPPYPLILPSRGYRKSYRELCARKGKSDAAIEILELCCNGNRTPAGRMVLEGIT